MKQCSFFELQLHSLDIPAALVFDVHVNENRVATDPSLTMEAGRQSHRLRTVSL